MTTLKEGHSYALSNFENKEESQVLHFICKEPNGINNGLTTVFDGTTNEEVLAVLIDRMGYLQTKFPCRENAIVITKLEECLMWLNKRTSDRQKRGVEGKQIA